MPHCQELQNQFEDINLTNDLSETKELLEEFKENGSEPVREKLQEKKSEINKLEKFEGFVQSAVDNLIAKHLHSSEFANKLRVEDGKVVCKDGLSFWRSEEIYFPSIIDRVEGVLNLPNITSGKNLKLPNIVEGLLNLRGITSAKHLELPREVGDTINLSELKSAKHLDLPSKIEGDIWLNNLASAEYLNLPDKVGGSLSLKSLESVDHLDLEGIDIEGLIVVNSLTSEEVNKLKEKYPHLADKITTSG